MATGSSSSPSHDATCVVTLGAPPFSALTLFLRRYWRGRAVAA
jgi:hypothetical protein